MRLPSIALLLAFVLLGAGCEIVGSSSDVDEDLDPLTDLPRALTASEQALIRSSNGFAFDFLREVDAVEDGANVFVSPLSASMALGMALNGAEGQTWSEMRDALGFEGLEQRDINSSFESLIELLRGLDPNVALGIANSLWLRAGVDFHDEYLTTVRDHFDATAETLDFDDPSSVDVINSWVDRNTNGRIESILDEIAQDAVLYLINAIYFKGDWTTQFDPDDTRPMPFHRADGATHDVEMMYLSEAPVSYAVRDGVQVVDIPYSRGAFSMTIALPQDESSLEELVDGLDEARWNDWVSALTEQQMDVYLPRFRLEYERSLNAPLQALGMRTAFEPGIADFSRMSPIGDRLYISEVKQKTFLDVNEEGTEAAAVTSVEVRVTSAGPSIVVDRPFLLVIRERLSGTIMFVGAIGAPESP